MTKNNKNRNLKNNLGFVTDCLKESKMLMIVLCALLLVTFLTGIIVAIKTNVSYATLEKMGVICFEKSGFFSRLLSMLLLVLICFGCSFTGWTTPLALLFLAYRAYLLGVNLCLIIVVNGIGGVVTAILIVLPCQLLALGLLGLFFLLLRKTNRDFRCYGGARVPRQKMKIIVCSLVLLLALCIIESLLFAIFSPTVILVI